MPSQFFKRKLKATAKEVKAILDVNPGMGMQEATDIVESTPTIEESAPVVITDAQIVVAQTVPPDLPLTGIDIFFDETDRKHKAIIFKYNPTLGLVTIQKIMPVNRSVALVYDNQKEALKTLIKSR